MRTTVTLDDALLAQAQQLCDENERSALGERESACGLAPWAAVNRISSRFHGAAAPHEAQTLAQQLGQA